jgi:ribosomal protein L12E/L44/L45/RPP1/RPP2
MNGKDDAMQMNPHPDHGTVQAVRRALIDAAEAAYEDAGIQGLCAEGRWEAAVSAMRRVDLDAVSREAGEAAESAPSAPADHNRTAGDRNGAVGVSGTPVHPHRP